MWGRKLAAAGIALALSFGAALAQAPQLGAGHIWGNSTAAARPGRDETVTAILDRALGSTRGALISRGVTVWGLVNPGAAGLVLRTNGAGADLTYGFVGMNGGGCNAALTPSAGGILWSTASTCAVFAGTATARLPLLSGASATPVWGAFTLPSSVISGGIAYFNTTSSMASSALITTGQAIISGGAGAAPVGFTGTSGGAAFFGTGGILQTTGLLQATQVLRGGGAGVGPTGFAGTTGGIGYFDGSGNFLSSATLTANQIVMGGGAGASPALLSCPTGTTLLHGGTPPTCVQLVFADIASGALATAAQYLAGTGSVLVPTSVIYPAELNLGNSGTGAFTFDTTTFINAAITMTGSITTMNLTAMAGKSVQIRFIQDATGSRTIAWNASLKWSKGVAPILTTTAAAVDVLEATCVSSSYCVASLLPDVH